MVLGKIESGSCQVGDQCLLMPNRTPTEIIQIFFENDLIDSATSGENIRLKLKNIDEQVKQMMQSYSNALLLILFNVGDFNWFYSLSSK
jgi:translation elongation factor EF-1alpha